MPARVGNSSDICHATSAILVGRRTPWQESSSGGRARARCCHHVPVAAQRVRWGRRLVGRAAGRIRRHRRQDHHVDPLGHGGGEPAAGGPLQRHPQEQGRADPHPDRQLPAADRGRRRRQEPPRRVRGRRHLHAPVHLQGAVPGHHRPHRRAAVQGQPGAVPHPAGHLRGPQVRDPPHPRPVGAVLQQGALPEGRPRPGQATHHPEGVRQHARTIRQKVGGKVYGTSRACPAAAASCSPTGRPSGPAAAR